MQADSFTEWTANIYQDVSDLENSHSSSDSDSGPLPTSTDPLLDGEVPVSHPDLVDKVLDVFAQMKAVNITLPEFLHALS